MSDLRKLSNLLSKIADLYGDDLILYYDGFTNYEIHMLVGSPATNMPIAKFKMCKTVLSDIWIKVDPSFTIPKAAVEAVKEVLAPSRLERIIDNENKG